MNKQNLVILLFLLFPLVGCKTTAEIKREQMVNNLSKQMVQNQRMSADTFVRIDSLEQKIGQLQGMMEEKGHSEKTKRSSDIQEIKASIKVLRDGLNNYKGITAENQTRINVISKQLMEQRDYIDRVLKSLSSLTKGMSKKRSKPSSPYTQAFKDYKRGRYKKARPVFLKLLKSKKLNKSKRLRILHAMGMTEYIEKNYDQSMIYFSKLYSDHPKSTYNKNGLFILGKTFMKLGDKENAIQTFEELIERFPKAGQVKDAKKLIQKLKGN